MAGRFVFQKLASGMSRSTSRLVVSPQASASSRATADACSRATTTAPAMTLRASEDGIRTLSRFFHNAAAAAVRPGNNVVPSISNRVGGIRGYSRVPAKVRRFKARMSPSINNHSKSSSLVDSVRQVKPTCSPDASNQLKLVKEPWYNRPVDLNLEMGISFLKTFLWSYAMAYLVFSACPKDVNVVDSLLLCNIIFLIILSK